MSGYLNITLNHSMQGNPIQGAQIFVTEHGNRGTVVKTLTTDGNGQVNYIELESGENAGEPLRKYDLIVQNPDYLGTDNKPYEYTKSGVQIWKDKVTINQDEFTQILKFEQLNAETRQNVINLPENNYFSPEEDKVYQNPLAIPDPYVNPDWVWPLDVIPFVPNEISIYHGTVNPYVAGSRINPKKIITENYKKYLKIVSTQEFGGIPNLTENAAIANLLLINSFALNRVFTEMYRNSGYDFVITDSVQFDQHYPLGGTIFENIESYVDNNFRRYIKLADKKQPLLAQYCAGKKGNCTNKGVPQLGLQSLSSKNKTWTPERLLKEYYDAQGIEFEIVTAEIIEGSPKSYPGYVLKLGMKDNHVKVVQEFLNTIRTRYPSKITQLDVDGEFGQKTKNAVVAFQELFEKTKKNKGEVDEATWYKMQSLYVEINKMAEPGRGFMKAFMYE
ncbi:peptidoglycan-binding protein [Paenibacillus sp. CN-4]|uniref:peptidoglycan-binding domain-containing protein n=1 Tax=Paenibacillus nanchangensis TaxID=3348343 RepID=UPI00397A6792